jgi:hypothetical protein
LPPRAFFFSGGSFARLLLRLAIGWILLLRPSSAFEIHDAIALEPQRPEFLYDRPHCIEVAGGRGGVERADERAFCFARGVAKVVAKVADRTRFWWGPCDDRSRIATVGCLWGGSSPAAGAKKSVAFALQNTRECECERERVRYTHWWQFVVVGDCFAQPLPTISMQSASDRQSRVQRSNAVLIAYEDAMRRIEIAAVDAIFGQTEEHEVLRFPQLVRANEGQLEPWRPPAWWTVAKSWTKTFGVAVESYRSQAVALHVAARDLARIPFNLSTTGMRDAITRARKHRREACSGKIAHVAQGANPTPCSSVVHVQNAGAVPKTGGDGNDTSDNHE